MARGGKQPGAGRPRKECKKCIVDRSKSYSDKNRQHVIAYKKEYGKNNRSTISAKNKIYRSKPEVRERRNLLSREYNKNNKEKFIEIRKKNRTKRNAFMKKYNLNMSKTNPAFNIMRRLRARVYIVLNGRVKKTTTTEFLGCTIEEFKIYFESLFTDGMSWEKYFEGIIHIDHKMPCKNFDLNNTEEQRRCFHYTNLQPLWAIDNLKKGSSIASICQ